MTENRYREQRTEMGSIGVFTFIKIAGPQMPKQARTVAINSRPGVDGTAFRLEALKAGQLTWHSTETFATIQLANAAVDDYTTLRGTKVTVIDDLGRQVNNVLVVDVIPNMPQRFAASSPSGIWAKVEAAWVLQPTE